MFFNNCPNIDKIVLEYNDSKKPEDPKLILPSGGIRTGHVNDSTLSELSEIVEEALNDYDTVKVGITYRPTERFKEHNYDNTHGFSSDNIVWDKAMLIYQSTSLENVRKIEKYLTEKFKDRLFNTNLGGGGKGGEGCQYVYLLLKENLIEKAAKGFFGLLFDALFGNSNTSHNNNNNNSSLYTFDDALKDSEKIVDDLFDDNKK